MFFENQSSEQKKEYQNFLRIAWCLSNLFSDSSIPYLYYRVAEKVFCRAFEAEDLSRSDVSADAKKEKLWIGLKTFLAGNHKTFQKVAEFNGDKSLYESLAPAELIEKISELRNTRIEFTENVHNLNESMYHCVIREPGRFLIYEESMDKIDIDNIKDIQVNKWSIAFNDWKHDYSFLVSKSTLTKRFLTDPVIFNFPVEILENPLEELHKLLVTKNIVIEEETRIKETIFLPLYGSDQTVFTKSGLNQWNAWGRKRNANEVYIPISVEIHKNFPNFFPNRETPFSIKLPNGNIMKSKICQDWGKALMSCSNRELWQWLLRDVLKLNEWELLTYDKLENIGIDSVRIDKIDNENFEINFSAIWNYEDFKKNFLSE